MATDLKLSHELETVYPEQGPSAQKKKGSGCGCFAIGCIVLLALILLPIIGGGIYIASLDDEEWGGFVVDLLKNKNFSGEFKVEMQKSTDMSAEQKTIIVTLYDNFLNNYDKLPEEKQKIIKKNISIVVKKLFTDPKQFELTPPPEFTEILNILGTSLSSTTTTTTTTTIDPYEFDLPDNIPNPNTPTPTPTDKTQTNETYDF